MHSKSAQVKGLKEECGITENSISNAKFLIKKFGIPNRIILNYVEDPWDYLTRMEWETDGSTIDYTMSGFSWSYRGEGSRGLCTLMSMCLGHSMADSEIYTMDKNVKDHTIFDRFGKDKGNDK